MQKFIGRKAEIRTLTEALESPSPQLVAIFGTRKNEHYFSTVQRELTMDALFD